MCVSASHPPTTTFSETAVILSEAKDLCTAHYHGRAKPIPNGFANRAEDAELLKCLRDIFTPLRNSRPAPQILL
jgi:hypothetical protein